MADRATEEQNQATQAPATPPPPPAGREMTPARRERIEAGRRFAIEAARLCADLRCKDVRVVDVSRLSPMCDFFVFASGVSGRQLRSVGNQVHELAQTHDMTLMGSTKRAEGSERWTAMDFIDVVVHLFDPDARFFYDLDGLWSDAPEVKWYEGDRPPQPTGPEPVDDEEDESY